MTEHAAAHAEGHAHHGYPSSFYIKMWAVLCVLLIISFVGPFVAHQFGSAELFIEHFPSYAEIFNSHKAQTTPGSSGR